MPRVNIYPGCVWSYLPFQHQFFLFHKQPAAQMHYEIPLHVSCLCSPLTCELFCFTRAACLFACVSLLTPLSIPIKLSQGVELWQRRVQTALWSWRGNSGKQRGAVVLDVLLKSSPAPTSIHIQTPSLPPSSLSSSSLVGAPINHSVNPATHMYALSPQTHHYHHSYTLCNTTNK